MKRSIKQLLRTPGKAVLFFLLTAGCTVLLVVGTVMFIQTNRQIDKVEREFTTIGTVKQNPLLTRHRTGANDCVGTYTNTYDVYSEILSADILSFDGANYTIEPETRPYYLTYLPDQFSSRDDIENFHNSFVAEIIPLSDSSDGEPVEAEVGTVLLSDSSAYDHVSGSSNLRTGDVITFCQHFTEYPVALQEGKHYYASMVRNVCPEHSVLEYIAYQAPYTSQSNENGEPVMGSVPSFPSVRQTEQGWLSRQGYEKSVPDFLYPYSGIEEVTEDFNVGKWADWALVQRSYYKYFPVLATNSVNLLPSFHERNAYIVEGRNITEREFETGAKVCLLPRDWTDDPWEWKLGAKITLPFYCTLYGYAPDKEDKSAEFAASQTSFHRRYSLLDSNGARYKPFDIEEYEVVGIYDLTDRNVYYSGSTEMTRDLIIVPSLSIKNQDQNIVHYGPMNEAATSFQIPNGTIEEFDQALRENVPEIEQLVVTYYDNGYTEVMGNLQAVRNAAVLLLTVGIFTTVAILVLLLYFFVIHQKKRTAIERSLGMSKRQCRISIIAGLLVLMLTATALGSASGVLLMENVELSTQQQATDEFDTRYSMWAKGQIKNDVSDMESPVPVLVYFAVPFSICTGMLLMALLFVNMNLKVEPIQLLSARNGP